jgi:polysaccharide export outer membrane protein
VGQGVQPKTLPYRAGMRVLDAIIEAGGLSQFASGNRARIVRTENGKSKQIKVRLTDLMNSGDIAQNILMVPGDVLVVPESRF